MTSGVFSTTPRLQPRYADDASGRLLQDRYSTALHQELAARAVRNQTYYDGTQYDEENAITLLELQKANPDLNLAVLPEHERINATSGHIKECIDFIADQLTDGFAIECADEGVQDVVDRAIDNSDLLKNGSDEEVAIDNLIVQASVKCDVPYQVLWDPVEQTGYFEFWEAQQVEFDVPTGRYVRGVTARYKRWVKKSEGGRTWDAEVEQREVYDLVPHLEPIFASDPAQPDLADLPAGFIPPKPVASETQGPVDFQVVSTLECRRRIYWDSDPEEEPRETHWLGIPFIPWEVLRVYQEGVYGFRGVPLISERAIGNVRRFDANEQQSYITTRFNAHATIVASGDSALLQLNRDPVVRKDLADILRFPSGTDVHVLQLTTDATMIEHTHDVAADAIFQEFGLTRVDPGTISGLGAPSGYALEILNRKSEGKLKRVRRTIKTDLVRMIDMLLDVTAFRRAAVVPEGPVKDLLEQDPEQDPDLFVEPVEFQGIQPEQVFSNREVEIRMGSGYIVDSVEIRDDFTAGLISHEESLRRSGYSEEDIVDMMEEEFSGSGSGSVTMDEAGNLIGSDGVPLEGEALRTAQEMQKTAATDREAAKKADGNATPASSTKAAKDQGSTGRLRAAEKKRASTRTRR